MTEHASALQLGSDAGILLALIETLHPLNYVTRWCDDCGDSAHIEIQKGHFITRICSVCHRVSQHLEEAEL